MKVLFVNKSVKFETSVRLWVAFVLVFVVTGANAQNAAVTPAALPEGPGKAVFVQVCSQCHQISLVMEHAVRGRNAWADVVDLMITRGAKIAPDQVNIIIDYLSENVSIGRLPDDPALLKGAPARTNPLDKIMPVTDAMLRNPSQGDWLTWRRTYDDQGFSPLKQIDKTNVANLRVAWSWTLPPGPNEGTPLVHDGVLFVQSYGDGVQAFNAVTGDLLWQYSRTLPSGVRPGANKRNLALYGDEVILGTSDTHVVALNIKTGNVIWDRDVSNNRGDVKVSGGPLVLKGMVLQGVGSGGFGQSVGGGDIVALDAETGNEKWRFHTIPQPGAPGADSWNGVPLEERTGAGVWTAGSYDPDLNLVYFGTGNTYNTAGLRQSINRPGITNDALYTDSTLALNPDTGKLAWHFQHVPNDQWDMDWVFEQMIINLPIDGQSRKVTVTSGKPMIYEATDAATGKYIFSKDLGLQNIFTAIDPKTGAKTVNPALVPGKEPFVQCPQYNSGKEWIPASYNAQTKILYIPVNEVCIYVYALPPGQHGLLPGQGWKMVPEPNSDGMRGHLAALNLATREIVWTNRTRESLTTGTLATAGGLVFAGSVDRRLKALDDMTGKELWQMRLNDVPSSAPISYAVNGKQYVAMVVGCGGVQCHDAERWNPEIQNPPGSTTIWVFELPEAAGKR